MKRLSVVSIILLLGCLALCALLLSGCGGKQTPADLGKIVYESQICKTCHMINGEGAKGPGPDLSHVGSKLSAEEIRTQIVDPKKRNPKGTMPAQTGIPKPDLDDLVAYLESLK